MSVRACIAVAILFPLLGLSRQGQQPFRAAITAVMVDVRVLDREGRLVTDLGPDDFQIFEDGRRQVLTHFVNPWTPSASLNPAETHRSPTSRAFVLVLGRGRLQGPARGLTAAEEFLREVVRPTDRVSVLAYRRATDFTTDHDALLRLLVRFRERHEEIEARLIHWFSGLQFVYGSPEIPFSIQERIDSIFDDPGLPKTRVLPLDITAFQLPALEDSRQQVLDDLMSDDHSGGLYNTPARHDIELLFAAVAWLRMVEGEKHLVFMTSEAFHLFGQRVTDTLAALASDSRVTFSTIQTGGVPLEWRRSRPERRGLNIPVLTSRSWTQTGGVMDAKAAADQTGGRAFMYRYASEAFEIIDEMMDRAYVLGYYSSQGGQGSYRRIEVRARRQGTTVFHRRGYYVRSPEGEKRDDPAPSARSPGPWP